LTIEQVNLSRVRVPLSPPYVGSRGIKREYLKTIVRIVTDSGLTGVGETAGSPDVFAKARDIARDLLGRDPLDRGHLRRRPPVSGAGDRRGIDEWIAIGGIEMALWDLAGKTLDTPVCYLLGGSYRSRIPMVCELTAAPFPPDVSEPEMIAFFHDLKNVDRIIDYAQEQIRQYGFRAIKLKSTGLNPDWDEAVMKALRESVGPQFNLRYDPNGAYMPSDAIALCRRLDRLGLQWFEDPTAGLEGMRRVRHRTTTKLATNMWVTQFADIPAAVRLGGVDVVGVDAFHWGGLANARDVVAIVRAFSLDIFIHCFFDLSITTAANLQLGAALNDLPSGIDTCLYLQTDDVVLGGKFAVSDGQLSVPETAGLGIDIDELAVSRLSVEEHQLKA
jgi:glucarate dehydratase